ncbi:hypothetical protein MMC09_001097 [Bachmanniomyces sp. S44760]|nr:hypothetical protein [Bachmanniomyces sp. S44760]
MDAASQGSKALSNKEFPKAVEQYTMAISQMPQAVDYYIKRSTALTRLSPADHFAALQDAETAVCLAQHRGKRELIAQGQLRRSIALIGLERWADAEACLGWVKKLTPKETSLPIWEKKVEAKLATMDKTDKERVVEMKEIPKVDLSKLASKQHVSNMTNGKENAPPSNNASNGQAKPEDSKPDIVQTPASKIRHEWYQTSETVVVTLFAKAIPKDRATIDIQAQSLAISFPLPTGSDYDLSFEPLFAQIDTQSSTSKIMSTKAEFVLKKAQVGLKWPSLEKPNPVDTNGKDVKRSNNSTKQAILNSTTPKDTPPSYPTSSRTGPKNWDKVASDLIRSKKPPSSTTNPSTSASTSSSTAPPTSTTTPDITASSSNTDKEDDLTINNDADDDNYDDDEDGDPVNGFFKKLYKDADPDTRRAMMKSYQESNGTALSTNWGEVGKGKVETSPPEGMVAKQWGK